MQLSFTQKKHIRKNFGKLVEGLSIPNLIEVQKNSYNEFLESKSVNEQISELAKQSLIKEMIKKNEITKFVDLNEQNDFADEYLKQFLLKLGFENEDDFKKELKKDNTYTFEEVKLKNKIEVYWNDLILSKYSNKININEKKLLKKIDTYSKKEKKEIFLSEIVFRKKKMKIQKI